MATSSHFDARLTYDDLVRMPDDGLRHEIINGVHFVTPSPAVRHQELVGRLYLALATFIEQHPEYGKVFVAPVDTVFSRWDVVVPDLVFVSAAQLDILTAPNVQGAPALVIEVLSPGTKQRDLGIKKDLFERGGVLEYWIVDPVANSVAIYRRAEDRSFVQAESLSNNTGAITTPLLPTFALPLEKLFRE
jgi:Uma2 family endonuclease